MTTGRDPANDVVPLAYNPMPERSHHIPIAALERRGIQVGNIVTPGRRVSFFLYNTGFSNLTTEGLLLLEQAMNWAADVNDAPVLNNTSNIIG